METVIPMLFSFWMCVIYIAYAIIMIIIWIGIGLMGGPVLMMKLPKMPPIPPMPKMPNPRNIENAKVLT